MSNAIFPVLVGLTWDVTKAPAYMTKIQAALSGREVRAAFRQYPLYTFNLSYAVLRATVANAELQSLMGFFMQRQGSFDSFLYTDPDDNTVTNQLLGLGDGVTTQFQLIRGYGGNAEPVKNINVVTNVKKATVIQTNPTDYSINAKGLITFTVAPGAGVSVFWTGTYYYRVRFLEDVAEYNQFMYQLWELKKLELYGSLGDKV